MNIIIDKDKLDYLYEIEPELYIDKPCRYQIRNKNFGLYSKRDAEVICEFLRNNFHKILNNAID